MKKGATFGLLLLFLGPIGSDRTTSAPGGASADEETVRSLDDQERKAVLDRNYTPLEHLWCEQLSVNSPANNVVIGLARCPSQGSEISRLLLVRAEDRIHRHRRQFRYHHGGGDCPTD